MKTRVLTASFAIVIASALSAHATCGGKHKLQTSTCIDGYVWDTESGSCVAQPST